MVGRWPVALRIKSATSSYCSWVKWVVMIFSFVCRVAEWQGCRVAKVQGIRAVALARHFATLPLCNSATLSYSTQSRTMLTCSLVSGLRGLRLDFSTLSHQ